MFRVAERMKLVSESITLAVSAKANAMKKAGIDVVGQVARALLPQQSENAAHFLAENQALVVSDRVTPLSPARFAITMLQSTAHGDAYTFRELDSMLCNAGFLPGERQVLPSEQSVIVSSK